MYVLYLMYTRRYSSTLALAVEVEASVIFKMHDPLANHNFVISSSPWNTKNIRVLGSQLLPHIGSLSDLSSPEPFTRSTRENINM